MILLVAGWLRWLILGLSLCGCGILAWQEWRRSDRRHVMLRVIASNVAIGLLALLGLQPARFVEHGQANPKTEEAALWTITEYGTLDDNSIELNSIPENRRFNLPKTNVPKGQKITLIPDAAFVRRNLPELKVLHLFGDGLEASDLEAVRGLRLVLHTPISSQNRPEPSIRFLHYPREIFLGESLVFQGSFTDYNPSDHYTLSLDGPDSYLAQTSSFIREGELAGFELSAPPPAAIGKFLWRLKLKIGGENGKLVLDKQIGISVVQPPVLQVLMLESSPYFETAQVQRWLSSLGSAWSARTLVGKDHYRFASSESATQDFSSVDIALLTKFDLVMADARALTTLKQTEQTALRQAITENGLGLLVMGSTEVLPTTNAASDKPSPRADTSFFLPWKLSPVDDDGASMEGKKERLARLAWHGLVQPLEKQIPTESAEIQLASLQRSLVRDSQGRNVAAAMQSGRGQVGITLVHDTWRWRQENDSAAFSAYWSHLLSQLRSAANNQKDQWSIIGGDVEPSIINQPVHLQWNNSVKFAGVAKIYASDGKSTNLPLSQDVFNPYRWQGTYWPRQEGWQRVRMPPDGRTFDFFVYPAGSWASLRADRSRAATVRAIALSAKSGPPDELATTSASPIPAGWLFTLFCASLTILWIERRFAV